MHSKLLIADDNTVIIGEQGLSGGAGGTGFYLDQSLPIPMHSAGCSAVDFAMLSFLS